MSSDIIQKLEECIHKSNTSSDAELLKEAIDHIKGLEDLVDHLKECVKDLERESGLLFYEMYSET